MGPLIYISGIRVSEAPRLPPDRVEPGMRVTKTLQRVDEQGRYVRIRVHLVPLLIWRGTLRRPP